MKVDRLIVLVLHSSFRDIGGVRAEDLRDGYALAAKFQKKNGKGRGNKLGESSQRRRV